MRVLVCGGRDYRDRDRVFAVLHALMVKSEGIDAIIEGGARGADRLAREFAKAYSTRCITYEADWDAHGSFAGPMRNKVMLEDGQPDLVVAFPGGAGTRDMVRKARKAGVDVVEIAP